MIGSSVSSAMAPYLNGASGTLALLCIWAAGLTLYTGWSWLTIAEKIGAVVMGVLTFASNRSRNDDARYEDEEEAPAPVIKRVVQLEEEDDVLLTPPRRLSATDDIDEEDDPLFARADDAVAADPQPPTSGAPSQPAITQSAAAPAAAMVPANAAAASALAQTALPQLPCLRPLRRWRNRPRRLNLPPFSRRRTRPLARRLHPQPLPRRSRKCITPCGRKATAPSRRFTGLKCRSRRPPPLRRTLRMTKVLRWGTGRRRRRQQPFRMPLLPPQRAPHLHRWPRPLCLSARRKRAIRKSNRALDLNCRARNRLSSYAPRAGFYGIKLPSQRLAEEKARRGATTGRSPAGRGAGRSSGRDAVARRLYGAAESALRRRVRQRR